MLDTFAFNDTFWLTVRSFLPVQSQAGKKDVPDMNDIMNDPMQALTKGWSLLSVAAVEGAKYAAQGAEQFTKYANENYVRPASQHLADPNLRNNVSAYVSNLTKKVNSQSLWLAFSILFASIQPKGNNDPFLINHLKSLGPTNVFQLGFQSASLRHTHITTKQLLQFTHCRSRLQP